MKQFFLALALPLSCPSAFAAVCQQHAEGSQAYRDCLTAEVDRVLGRTDQAASQPLTTERRMVGRVRIDAGFTVNDAEQIAEGLKSTGGDRFDNQRFLIIVAPAVHPEIYNPPVVQLFSRDALDQPFRPVSIAFDINNLADVIKTVAWNQEWRWVITWARKWKAGADNARAFKEAGQLLSQYQAIADRALPKITPP
ncbi:MAG: hypothetical protein HY078_02800 [Elusimicrobia bacterium]|nr:hypothetical protein [Elusimicrobiota bacterium]